ncbi:MAG: hypothetical protein EOO45_07650, partial [Flavobacterium sp.]
MTHRFLTCAQTLTYMKKALLFIILFFAISVTAQQYTKEWEKVLEYEAEGLIKSAAATTDAIYVQAKKDRNEPQLLKTFFFRAKFMQVLEEDAQVKILEALRQEMKMAGVPSRAVMESLYADMLNDIYNRNQYQINKRLDTDDNTDANFLTWSGKDFREAIESAYKRSIAPREVLYNTSLDKYEAIIDFSTSKIKTNRSLYDFLAARYLKFSFNMGYIGSVPLLSMLPQLFGNAKQFSELPVPDDIQPELKDRLLLFQEMEKFYSNKKDSNSLLQSVLRRLQFLDSKIYNDAKRPYYIATLTEISQLPNDNQVKYSAMLLMAELYRIEADKIRMPDNLIRAVAICDEIIANKEFNDLHGQATQIREAIVFKGCEIQIEKVVIPNQPILAKLTYSNMAAVRIEIFKITHNSIKSNMQEYDYAALLKDRSPLITQVYNIPEKTNHFSYSTEIILPSLDKGLFLITIEPAEKVSGEKNLKGYVVVQASSMAIVKETHPEKKVFQIVDRASGKVIKSVKAKIEAVKYRSDSYGSFEIKQENKSNGFSAITFFHEGDTLTESYYEYYPYNKDREEIKVSAQVYLDRAIYRPGQTVHFKAIFMQQKNGVFSTVPNINVVVTIDDNNVNEVKKFKLATNEFGSVAEKFTLPGQSQTGEYSIEIEEDDEGVPGKNYLDEIEFDGGYNHFRVEEYKRPTFDVEFDKVTQTVRLNENMKVTGKANAFSGAAISGAKVKYRVVRTSRRFYDDYSGDSSIIKTGESITDPDGKFEVEFIAEPDKSIDPKTMPIFTYSIDAYITDISGETHEGITKVYAGYHSIVINAAAEPIMKPGKENRIVLDSKNLNGEFSAVTGTIKIYKLTDEERVLRKRPWGAPEIQTISKQEFIKNFPHLPYGPVQNDSLLREQLIFEQTVNTSDTKAVLLKNLYGWRSGRYQVVFAAKDAAGFKAESISAFILNKEKRLSVKNVLTAEIINNDFKKDDYILVRIQSALPVLYAGAVAYNEGNRIFRKQLEINGGSVDVKIPFNKKSKTATKISFDAVWQNQFYEAVVVADANKAFPKLEIESETLNNKLLPGSPQTWSFTIKDSGKVPAEVLASMYDVSLDQFNKHEWDMLNQENSRNYNSIPHRYFNNEGSSFSDFNRHRYNRERITMPEDMFYTYGFKIDESANIYRVYALKKQANKEGLKTVRGIVLDLQGLPIPGVTVRREGTNEGVQTDFDGFYSMYALPGDKLIFTFIGMATQTGIVEKAGAELNITMEDDAVILDGVAVEGYRATGRAKANADIAVFSATTFDGLPNKDFVQSLQGQIPGLNISGGSGSPGSANTTVILRGSGSINGNTDPLYVVDGVPLSQSEFRNLNAADIMTITVLKDAGSTSLYGARGANGVIVIKTKQGEKELEALQQVQARKNLDETAFFFPQLKTDKDGKISFSFTTPEALTEWKMRLMAHNRNAVSGYLENTFVTQKDLMVVPNMPRFLREKDTLVVTAKITNMTAEAKKGNALLQLFDALSMQPADLQMLNNNAMTAFELEAKGSTTVSWKITVPINMQAGQYKILAKAGDFTDGEEGILPVLTNSMLVTESLPLWIKPGTKNEYSFKNFKENTSATLRHQGITLEYTSNPAWLALQSLPYLMEYEHQCAEQVFSRYYANSLAASVLNSNPKIAEVFAAWRKEGKPVSKLEQNEELKSIIAAESPWLLDAQSEEEKKNRIALLFDLDKMKNSAQADFNQLSEKQMASGGFAWFDGGKENEYITRHILAGLGHLTKLLAGKRNEQEINIAKLTRDGIAYLDTKFLEEDKLQVSVAKKNKKEFRIHNPYSALHYLYTRSFYHTQLKPDDSLQLVINKYLKHSKDNWLE